MKAATVIPGRKALAVQDVAEPKITEPTQVKLQMLQVGICGTDREIAAFDYGTPPEGSEFLIIGHESLGQVVETGSAVTDLKKGDLVIPMVRRPCDHPECLACRADRQDFCYTGDFTERGIKGRHGFMTEVVVDDQKYMNKVPASLRDIAVLVEPLTIAEKALTQVFQVQQRLPWACPLVDGKPQAYCHAALVLGAGPVGLLGAMALLANGFETFVYSRSPGGNEKQKLVEAIGGKYIAAETHSVEDVVNMMPNIDLVYEAVGASSLAFEVIENLGTNGVFVFTGVPGRKAPIEVDTDRMMRNLVLKNQVVFGTVNANKDAFTAAIADLGLFSKKWPNAVQSLITGRFAIDQFKDLLVGKPEGIKNIIEIQK